MFSAILAMIMVSSSVRAGDSPELPHGPWRLFRIFEPIPGPQRGVDIWALERDLTASSGRGNGGVISTMTFDKNPVSGVLLKTSYAATEYDCEQGRFRTLWSREIARDATEKVSGQGLWARILPYSFDDQALFVVCRGRDFEDRRSAADAAEALAVERAMDQAFHARTNS
jgi:hypothetical protein